MPTGKEWDAHFKRLKPAKRKKVLNALMVLNSDSMFRKAYGNDFKSLAWIIKYPFK